jgi:AcrR family transcriptional regulator
MAYLSYEERRRQLVDAAVQVIVTEGLAKTTTRRVAEQADAPLGALHYCFSNKQDLMNAVLDRGTETFAEVFAVVGDTEGVEATIRSCVDAYWRWTRDHSGLNMALQEMLLWMIRHHEPGEQLHSSLRSPFGGEVMRAKLRRACDAEAVELAVPIDDIVRFIIDHFDGMLIDLAASGDLASNERHAGLLADALIGLAMPGPQRPRRAQPKNVPSSV